MKNFKLHNLHHAPGSVKKSLRVGRGNSARKGNKCGKGSNGNQQRSGYKRKLGFEGGQTPLNRRIPMQRHINKYRKNKVATVTIDMLSGVFNSNVSDVNKQILVDYRIINNKNSYKIIKGKKNIIPEGIKIYADAFSEGAKKVFEDAKSTWLLQAHDEKN